MNDPEAIPGDTPKRYDAERIATARTPNDYNRGVQNATEAGIAENRRVLDELEEVRAVQRRELAELVIREFSEFVPSLTDYRARRGEEPFDQVISILRSSVQDDKTELRELREALAEAQTANRREGHDPRYQRMIEQLREQIADDEDFIRYLQETRSKEAQVILDWKKDILLWMKRYQGAPISAATRSNHFQNEGVSERRTSRRRSPTSSYREYEDDEFDVEPQPEQYFAPPRMTRGGSTGRRPPSSNSQFWREQEEKLLDILEQGEKMYDRIMETSAMVRRKLGAPASGPVGGSGKYDHW